MANRQIDRAARAKHSRAYAGLFLLFLVCGLAAGLPVGRSVLSMIRLREGQRPGEVDPVARPATGQGSWLILGVNDLHEQTPRLESAWLALFFPGNHMVTLLPLFPVPGGNAWADEFSTDPHGAPAASFLDALRGEGLWWTGYVLLDTTSLAILLDVLKEGPADFRKPGFFDPAQELGDDWYSFDVQNNQTSLLESACRRANGLLSPAEVKRLAAGFSTHLRTDLDLVPVAYAWPVTEAGKLKLECEFPMLAVSR